LKGTLGNPKKSFNIWRKHLEDFQIYHYETFSQNCPKDF
jgi:hypothetical protein